MWLFIKFLVASEVFGLAKFDIKEWFDLVFDTVRLVFGYVQILFDSFEMEAFIIGILFVLLVGRLLLKPLFGRKDL